MKMVKPGDIVRVTNGAHYSLPPGLAHGDLVKLIRFDHGYWECERLGKRYLVFLCRIEAGFDYEIAPGRWVSENHPRVRALLGDRAKPKPEEPVPLARMT